MVSILHYDNYCKLIDEDDPDLFQALDLELSFKIQGAEFSAAYKGYTNDLGEFVTWDGRRHLLTSKGTFPSGLLPRVVDFLQKKGIYAHIIDKKNKKDPISKIDIYKSLEKMGIKTRDYQEQAADIAIKHDRGIIRLPTGAGKSIVAALIAAKIGKKTIIYVIGKDLLHQFHKLFEKVFEQKIGIIGDGICEIRDINIATVWSVGQALGQKKVKSLDDSSDTEKKIDTSKFSLIKKMLLETGTHIIDECHLSACDTIQVIAKNIKPEHVYGMSASPWRDDGADLLIEAFLGRRIVDVSARSLINQGYLVEPFIKFLAPEPYKYKTGNYQKIYTKYIVENDQRNSMIAKATLRMIEQKFVPLILFHSVKHGDILYDKLKGSCNIELLSGKDKSSVREKIKEEIEGGKVKALLASKIFDIGVDLPILSGLVVAGGGKSSVRALQRIGRVIRPYPGKSMAAVLDFADQAPHLLDHAMTRKKIYESEFETSWPQEKKR
jgi:superfamily II DNA or RNA helicase